MEFDEETRVHTVFYVSEDDDGDETVEAQVLVADGSGEITEVRVGPQVAWSMARGYDDAFGGAITDPQIWIPLVRDLPGAAPAVRRGRGGCCRGARSTCWCCCRSASR